MREGRIFEALCISLSLSRFFSNLASGKKHMRICMNFGKTGLVWVYTGFRTYRYDYMDIQDVE
jgi:hypothetical protein